MPRHADDFQTIHSEGGLLPADLLRKVVDPRANLPGTRPENYGLPQGERINESITQSWNRLRRHWAEFRTAARNLPPGEAGTGLTNDKWTLPLLRELGFGLLPTSPGPEAGGRTYAISRFFGPTAVHLVGCGLSLDRRAAGVRGAAASNPHGLVQEFLNRSPGQLWAILSNGLRFRILRDNQALSRQSYLGFDLEAMFTGEVFSDFVLLWLMAHATRFAPQTEGRAETCWLEQWTKIAADEGTRALGALRAGVEKALQILGEAFVSHRRNTALREALRNGQLALGDFHGQLLRLVYRLIFLFVADDRTLDGISLLHPRDDSEAGRQARERYAAHYSTARLRDLAGKIKGSRHGDLWQQFNLLVGALSGDARFESARQQLALPALGSFLWSPESTAVLNAVSLSGSAGVELANADLLEALRHLAFTRQGKMLRPVDYKNLGAEELGGVYESLLALTPQISGDGARFTFAEFAGNERRTSGSYYTPDSLVQCLLDSALDPVVEEALKDKSGAEAEKAILSLKVCDPAVGSGHFLVGAAHRLARHLARVRANSQGESEPSPLLYQHALRDVIGRCLYGVDINPMAAELCRVGLWLEALEPGKPLSFLDHHIQVGNSLIGTTPALLKAGIPEEAFAAIEGDEKTICTSLRRDNRREREDYARGYRDFHFIKQSGRYQMFAPGNLGKGDFNVYRFFVELAISQAKVGGWAAQLVPEGLYNGANCMAIRQSLFETCRLDCILGFENANEVWFKDIDTRMKFCLYAAQVGACTETFRAAFNVRSQQQLAEVKAGRFLSIPVRLVKEFSPDALAIMELGSQLDIDIAAKMYRWPAFGDESAKPPHRVYMAEVHMGNDRELFTEDRIGIPLYEGRMVAQYDHRAKGYQSGRGRSADWQDLPFDSPNKSIQPQWYISRDTVPEKCRDRIQNYRIGFCDVASPTNERSLVAAIVPPGVICGHSVPTILLEPHDSYWSYALWIAIANSYTMDFVVRTKVALHLTFSILDSLPFPRLDREDRRTRELVTRCLRLTCTGPEMIDLWNSMADEGWVSSTNSTYEIPGELNEDARLQLRAEIDAIVARELFELTRPELEYILTTFPTQQRYQEEQHGEFRSQRLILHCYDKITASRCNVGIEEALRHGAT